MSWDATPMPHAIHTKIGSGRRVVIPADLCRAYGLAPGSPVVLEPTEDGIILRRYADVARDVQGYFEGAAPKGLCLSDALRRDRREEAEREARD